MQKVTLYFSCENWQRDCFPFTVQGCVGRLGRSQALAAPLAPLLTSPAIKRQKQSSSTALRVAGRMILPFQMGTPSLHTPPVLDAVQFAESNIQRRINVSRKIPLSSYRRNEPTALMLMVTLGSSRVPSLPTWSLVSCAGGEQAVHVSFP